jgi:hypothetical protein
METPLCLPTFFCLSGTQPDEGCVIERLETEAVVHEAPAAVSNHWRGFCLAGHDRGNDSPARCDRMLDHLETARAEDGDDFDWLVPPLLNRHTRLGVVANAARGWLAVQGWERTGPATEVFTLSAPPGADTGGRPERTMQALPPEAAA